MNSQNSKHEPPKVHLVPAPWHNAVENVKDEELIDIEHWDDKTSPRFNLSRTKGHNEDVISFQARNTQQRCFS